MQAASCTSGCYRHILGLSGGAQRGTGIALGCRALQAAARRRGWGSSPRSRATSQQLQRTETHGKQPRNPEAWPGAGNDSPLASSPQHIAAFPAACEGRGSRRPANHGPRQHGRGCTWSCPLDVGKHPGEGLILLGTKSHMGSASCISRPLLSTPPGCDPSPG